MAKRSAGQRGPGRMPKSKPGLNVEHAIYGVAAAIERFVQENEGSASVWIWTGPKGPRNETRDTLEALRQRGDILRWRGVWGKFEAVLSQP